MKFDVVVTRHAGLLDYAKSIGLLDGTEEVISHATPENVRGKNVFGVLPMSFAVHAASITEIPMNLPVELRGKEIPVEEMGKYAGQPASYQVKLVIKYKNNQ